MSSPGNPAIKSKCCFIFFISNNSTTFSLISLKLTNLLILFNTSSLVVWTPTSNWNLSLGAFLKISNSCSFNISAEISKWNWVLVSLFIKNSQIAVENLKLQLKVLSTNFTSLTFLSIKNCNSLFTLSISKNLTPWVVDDKQYLQLNGHPFET